MTQEPTKRRGPIGAEYSSPGPIYKLPPLIGRAEHDLRYRSEPAWHFGSRHGKLRDISGPGPAYALDSKLLRNGNSAGLSFSIYSRPIYLSNYLTPDPGRYNYEIANRHVWRSYPSFSFGSRNDQRHSDNTPGPNIYSADPMMNGTLRSNKPSAPKYSLYSRSKVGGFSEDLKKTPGPAAYKVPEPVLYMTKQPAATITGRIPLPGDNTIKPGPQTYNPILTGSQGFSFGQHHSQYRGHLIVDGDIAD